MKRFIKLMSAMLVLGAVATASTTSSLPSTGTVNYGGKHCDAIEQLMGVCREVPQDLINGNPEV